MSKDIGDYGIRIRMYRQGVGDCFLLRFAKQDSNEKPYTILIDCGVHQATKGGSDTIRKVAKNIRTETQDEIDVVVGTHEHWDHISGFHQARDEFKHVKAKEVWLAWTEDNADELAKKLSLKNKRYRALNSLTSAAKALRLGGDEKADKIEGLLGFFGPGGGKNLKKAGDALVAIGEDICYLKPSDAPREISGVEARVYALGPPRDLSLIDKSSPSKSHSEAYEFGGYMGAAELLEQSLKSGDLPFANQFSIPLEASKGLNFFTENYWADTKHPDAPEDNKRDDTQYWRRVDTAWLGAAESIALHLDHDTNNTSLVLAIELGPVNSDGPVLIFAADAQVGNWLAWRHHSWKVGGRNVTGEDLLRRTILYKVGHHASHNATLREHGLELMDDLEVALIPTSADMAKKVGWGNIPWPPLLKRLDEKTEKKVIRSDKTTKAKLGKFKVLRDSLFYEISL